MSSARSFRPLKRYVSSLLFCSVLRRDNLLTPCLSPDQDLKILDQNFTDAAAARSGINQLLLQAEGLWSRLGNALSSARNAQAQTRRSMEEVAKLAEDVERQEHGLKEAVVI